MASSKRISDDPPTSVQNRLRSMLGAGIGEAQLDFIGSIIAGREVPRNALDYVEDEDGIVYDDISHLYTPPKTTTDAGDMNNADQDENLPYICDKDPEFKKRLTELCREYKDIFSSELRPEPADVRTSNETKIERKYKRRKPVEDIS